ncbi:hypothetical protein GE09DRAFT_1050765 [Coniochaeta sp. 2T2.1]|nr:hypothetical protein GE09DRAFT_1050765 [Coniochaeta sp. 2T2.1]
MCYAEEVNYRCGHRSAAVVRPCPLTTSGHNNPVCQIQFTYEYSPETMSSSIAGIMSVSSQIKEERRSSHNKRPVDDHVDKGKRVVVVGGKPGHCPEDHIPARYQETTEGDKTHVAVRQASQYAAEWLEDHREVHAQGGCNCGVEMKPITTADSDGPMTANGGKVLALHHQITGDGLSKEEWTPPSKEDIDRWRKETDVPDLGTQPKWTVNRRQAPDATKYPVPLGNNMFLTEHFVVWDAKLLASRVESMQISSPTHGHGGSANVKVSNGKAPAAQEPVHMYQPQGNGHHKGMQKKGGRRAQFPSFQLHQPMHHNQYYLPTQQHQPQVMDYGMPAFPVDQQHARDAMYGTSSDGSASPPEPQQRVQHGRMPGGPARQCQQQMRAQQPSTARTSVPSPPYDGNVPHNMDARIASAFPQQPLFNTPAGTTFAQDTKNIVSWNELTPPSTRARKGSIGNPPISSSGSDMGQTPTKPSQKVDKQPLLPPANVNGTRNLAIENPSGEGTSSGSTSALVHPSPKDQKTARRSKAKANKKERKLAQKGDKFGVEIPKQPRCHMPLCGLPIGAGPESSKPHMPAFENCSLFRHTKKHRRGSSCPQFEDSQALSSSD